MPAVDPVLLLICLGLTLVGVVVTAVSARRGRRGRVVQGVGLILAPVALYLSGLLGLLWGAVAAVGAWAAVLVLSPAVWLGLSLLAVSLVLFGVGGVVARRAPAAPRRGQRQVEEGARPAVAPAPRRQAGAPAPVDDDMAEIEALLKKRGIN